MPLHVRRVAMAATAALTVGWAGGVLAPATAQATETRIVIVTPGLKVRIGDTRVRTFKSRRFDRRGDYRHFDRRSFRRGDDRHFRRGHDRFKRHRGFDHRFRSKRDRRFDRRFRGVYDHKRRSFRSYRYKGYRFRRR